MFIIIAAKGHQHKKRKSKSSSPSQQPLDLDRHDIETEFEKGLSDNEYGQHPSRQSQVPLQQLRGKELARSIRQAERNEHLANHQAQLAQNSRSNRHRNSGIAQEQSTHDSDSGSSGSESEEPNKENMVSKTRAQRDAEAEAARLAAENTRLEKKLAAAEKNTATYKPSKDEVSLVESKVKFVMFSKYQFNIKEEDTQRITGKLYIKMHTKEQRIAHGADGKSRWIATMTPIVSNTLSVTRGYRSQELRKVCIAYAKEHGTLPSLGLILNCLLGDIHLNNQEELDVYHWFWTRCMPCAAMGTNWSATIRNYTLMHKATPQHDKTVRF